MKNQSYHTTSNHHLFLSPTITVIESRILDINSIAIYYPKSKKLIVSSMVYYFIKWELRPLKDVLLSLKIRELPELPGIWGGVDLMGDMEPLKYNSLNLYSPVFKNRERNYSIFTNPVA